MSGELHLDFDDLRLDLGPGDHWLVSVWEPHAWRPGASGAESLVIIFLPEMMDEILPSDCPWLEMFAALPRDRPLSLRQKARADVNDIARELWGEIRTSPDHWDVMVRLGLARLLVALHRSWRPSKAADVSPRADTNQLSRVMPAITLANSDFRSRIGPRQAANECGLSASRFHHVFKQTLGVTFGHFRMRARLAQAAHLLLATDMPTEAIAEQTGFVDGSHLYRRFMSQYGCTPAHYRSGGRSPESRRRRARR